MRPISKRFWRFPGLLLLTVLLHSCYSAVLTSTHGEPMPEINDREDFFRDKMVIEYDTVVKAGVAIDYSIIPVQRKRCETGKLHSVEFRNTFGGVLLYLVTFGSKRKVSIKYVCVQP
ncbi:hypothetical protein GWK08_09005 [Leptobacterium flavescens]|uniref:DUF4258 domain-containing protein n=1 Tax=Leptobacterium flavescens TaxID=472055 RepID=A0A6P0URS8_9FLAO|nr:hypothetical protein [Leptobacterium flavescens]NER13573.1 hypothetical protein [Leptobacterium flavescens]